MENNEQNFATITFTKDEFIMLYHAMNFMESSSSNLSDPMIQDSNDDFHQLFYQLFDKIEKNSKDVNSTSIFDI